MSQENQRPASAVCPNDTDLLTFRMGRIDGDALEGIGSHVSSCTNCEERLESLEGSEDSVLSNLRRFLEKEQRFEDGEIRGLTERGKAALDLAVSLAPPTRDFGFTPSKPEPLSRLDRYELAQELGRGGMGIVYAAFHGELNKRFALKVIHPAHLHDPQAAQRFRREIRALGDLNHVNIVAATDAGEAEGRRFLVMEYVEGIDLSTLLRVCRPVPVADACEILRQAAVGLQYVHERGWVHRDLKPSNLMLSSDGVVKILDLGLARVLSEDPVSGELTRSDQAMGTTDYMAPEQWSAGGAVDIRADIYSLGCTLYKLLSGVAPFADVPNDKANKKSAHEYFTPRSLMECRADVPKDLNLVVMKMLAKSPGDRFQEPSEVIEALSPHATGFDLFGLLRNASAGKAKQKAGAKTAPVVSGTANSPPKPESGAADVRLVPQKLSKRRVAGWVAALLPVGLALVVLARMLQPPEPSKEKEKPDPEKPSKTIVAKPVKWPGEYPPELRGRALFDSVELVGLRPRRVLNDCEARHPLEPRESAAKLYLRPLWCRRLFGGGSYTSSPEELRLSHTRKAVPSCATIIMLENDLQEQWFEFVAELPRLRNDMLRSPRGLFFGWHTEGDVGQAYFIHLNLDTEPGLSLHGELVCGPAKIDLRPEALGTQKIVPLRIFEETAPVRIRLNKSVYSNRIHVRALPNRIVMAINDEAPVEFEPQFDPRGPRGIWAQDGEARFGRVTSMMLAPK